MCNHDDRLGVADDNARETNMIAIELARPPAELDPEGFEAKLVDLPGKYAPPYGRLLLATNGETQPDV